jgi:hypothetical protein
MYFVIVNIPSCDTSPESSEGCRISSLYSCSDYSDVDSESCGLKLSVNGLCVWVVNEDNDGGNCVDKSSISCASFNEVQCISNSINSLHCFWDNTGSSGICKTKSTDQCYNFNHFSPQNGICTIKLCSDRTSNSEPTKSLWK